MLYLTRVTECLFPGKDLADLEPHECYRIIQYVAQIRGTAIRAMRIPEILCRVLGHLSIKHRERVREVCVDWNSHVVCARIPQEINLLVPVNAETIHLGMVAMKPEYIEYVRTQEEFDKLWPAVCWEKKYIVALPRAEFVTSETVQMAFSMVTATFGNLVWSRWILGLRYEVFIQLSERLKDMSIYPETAGLELSRKSREGTLDPRIIEGLYYRHRVQMTSYFIDHHRAYGWQSPLAIVLSMCPEMAIWKRLRCKWLFNARDFIESSEAVRLEAACSELDEDQFISVCRDWHTIN